MHVLARLDIAGKNMPPDEQKVGSFTGFQANTHEIVVKSTAYYFLTFPKPPQKSVVHEVICRMVAIAELKSMPFIQLVDDQPVYTLIVQLKNENPKKFKLNLPFLGPFHTHTSLISAIYKLFHGSGLSEILVAADITQKVQLIKHFVANTTTEAYGASHLCSRCSFAGFFFRRSSKELELSSEL